MNLLQKQGVNNMSKTLIGPYLEKEGMSKSNAEWNEFVPLDPLGFEMAYFDILNDWNKERAEMIEVMKMACDTLHPLNYDSYNADMARDELKKIITKAERK